MEEFDYQGYKLKEFIEKVKKDPEKYGQSYTEDGKFRDEEVAEALKISQTQLYKYFKAETTSRKTAERFTKTFNVADADIWGNGSSSYQQYNNMFIISRDVLGNFLNGWDDYNFLSGIRRETFIFFKGECYAFEVIGNEMADKYQNGGYVVSTVLHDINTMVRGQEYEFQTEDQLLLRTFEGMNGDKIRVSCLNEAHNPQPDIPLSKIVNVFQIRCYINF